MSYAIGARQVPVLRDVDLRIAACSRLASTGPSGSGRTSLLLLAGLERPTIGGLGVLNSVQAYLQGELTSLATLRALGLRDNRLTALVLLQILLLALLASVAGTAIGIALALALAGAQLTADKLPATLILRGVWPPALMALLFGVLTALASSLPPLGSALTVPPAALFRGVVCQTLRTPRKAWWTTAAVAFVTLVLLVASQPDPRFGAPRGCTGPGC